MTRALLESFKQLKKREFSGCRIFGCQTWIRPPSKRSVKFKHNIVKGIFLGFIPHTVKTILWYNYETGKIDPANHVRFDEGMNDLPYKLLPPNQYNLNLKKLMLKTNHSFLFILFLWWKKSYWNYFLHVLILTLVFKLNLTLSTAVHMYLMLMLSPVPPNCSRLSQLQDKQFVSHI